MLQVDQYLHSSGGMMQSAALPYAEKAPVRKRHRGSPLESGALHYLMPGSAQQNVASANEYSFPGTLVTQWPVDPAPAHSSAQPYLLEPDVMPAHPHPHSLPPLPNDLLHLPHTRNDPAPYKATLPLTLAAIDVGLGVGPLPVPPEVARNAVDASDIDAAASFVSAQTPTACVLPSIAQALDEAIVKCNNGVGTQNATLAECNDNANDLLFQPHAPVQQCDPIAPVHVPVSMSTPDLVPTAARALHAQEEDAASACSSVSCSAPGSKRPRYAREECSPALDGNGAALSEQELRGTRFASCPSVTACSPMVRRRGGAISKRSRPRRSATLSAR